MPGHPDESGSEVGDLRGGASGRGGRSIAAEASTSVGPLDRSGREGLQGSGEAGSDEATRATAPVSPAVPSISAGRALPSAPPVSVPNHVLVRCLGRGGFGEVWLARHRLTEHYRACKLIPAAKSVELDGLKRLRQRVPAHPHLFPIEEVGEANGWLYVLMPLADNAAGGAAVLDESGYEPLTLRVHLERQGRMSAPEAARVGADLCGVVAHLHGHGVTHGDIKPANIMRLNGAWAIADYGLLRDLSRPTGEGHSPGYIPPPPEPPGTPMADQYALGVTVMEMLTGWPARRLADFRSAPAGTFGFDGDGRAVREAILRATAASAVERFASVRELAGALDRAQAWRKARRKRADLIASAVLVLVLGGVGAWVAWSRTRAAPTMPAPEAAFGVSAFDIRLNRFDGTTDIPSGQVGRDAVRARVDDSVEIHASFSAPAYAYLLALDPAGEARLVYPCDDTGKGLPETAPVRAQSIVYPPRGVYHLGSIAGTQGFVLLASAVPLPPWTQWESELGKPRWPPGEIVPEGYVFDGGRLSPLIVERGEVIDRRGTPQPIVETAEWAKRSGADAVRFIAFPVVERGS